MSVHVKKNAEQKLNLPRIKRRQIIVCAMQPKAKAIHNGAMSMNFPLSVSKLFFNIIFR